MTDAPSPRYVALLALVAIAVLGLGYVLKPGPRAEVTVGSPSPAEVRRLQRLALRRSIESLPEYVGLIARDLAPYVVRVGSEGQTGIVWATDFAVSTPVGWRPSAATTVATARGDLLPASAVVSGPHLPLAGYQAPISQGLAPAPRRTEPIQPAEWLIAVWRDGANLGYAPTHAAGAVRASCGDLTVREIIQTLALSPAMAGGGLFDLDGRLTALILPCGERLVALSTGSVDTLIMRGQLLESRLLARFGVGVGVLDEAERRHFGLEQGLIVREVWSGYPALASGLRAGDVILALDGAPVATPSDLEDLLHPSPEAPHRLRVSRGGRIEELSMDAAVLAPPAAPPRIVDRGLGLGDEAEGLLIQTVAPETPASRAGLRPGDRLLRVDHELPRSLAALRRLLAGEQTGSVFVEVERGPRQLGALLGT